MNKALAMLNSAAVVLSIDAHRPGWAALAAAMVVWCAIDAVRERK
jgi:hypothetical protein